MKNVAIQSGSIANSIRSKSIDNELYKRTQDNAAVRARRRERERQEKEIRRKRLKNIIYISASSLMLLMSGYVAFIMFIKTVSS